MYGYEAELSLAAFAVEFAARDWSAAGSALDAAEAVAVRESSRRNVHFLRGRLAFARGDFADAVTHFERGAASPYRCQGGPSLLDWGDALVKLGRPDDARAAWERCLTQDPQSPAAATARLRLGEPTAP